MKATDLRIGNLFQEIESKEIIMVIELSIYNIGFSGSFKKGWKAEPIELTEEWLLKMGFEKFDEYSNFFLSEKYYNFKIHGGLNYVAWHNLMIYDFEPKYVHQLQNLYYALTGEELTFK